MVAHKAAYQTPSKAFLRSLHVPVEEDCTGGLVIEVFDDSTKIVADVVLLHGCPQSCIPNPVEGLLEVYACQILSKTFLNSMTTHTHTHTHARTRARTHDAQAVRQD